MADTIAIAGHQVPKGYVIGGAAAVAGLALISWYRQKQAAAAAPAAAATTTSGPTAAGDQYPPDGTTGNPSDPYSTDPATGDTYGDEAGGGYVGTGVANFGGGGYYGAGTGNEGPGYFTSNAYWTQYCEQLMGSTGNDAISAALGAYIAGTAPPAGGTTIIEQAIAIAGYPPVAGAGGFPPSIQPAPSGAGGGAGGGTAPSGSPVIVSLPNGQGGWENITFPNQAAVTQWDEWNENFASTHGGRTQAYRSEWNAELASLGATGMIPIATYNPSAPLGSPTNDGNPNDYR